MLFEVYKSKAVAVRPSSRFGLLLFSVCVNIRLAWAFISQADVLTHVFLRVCIRTRGSMVRRSRAAPLSSSKGSRSWCPSPTWGTFPRKPWRWDTHPVLDTVLEGHVSWSSRPNESHPRHMMSSRLFHQQDRIRDGLNYLASAQF